MIVHLTKTRSLPVTSLEDAASKITAHWKGKSSTRFYHDPKAGVIEGDAGPFAYVSYNGCVWDGTNRFNLNAKRLL